MRRYILPTLKVKRSWLGIVIIAGAFAILAREPIQFNTQYWTLIFNLVLSYAVAIPGAVLLALGIVTAQNRGKYETQDYQ